MDRHESLMDSLKDPSLYDHSVEGFTHRETHISSILLTGPYAYKIKKPARFDFLDFSTLDRRQFYLRKELELNRRLCPDLYVKVLPISGSPQAPVLDGSSDVFEYALKMVQFSENKLFIRLAENNALTPEHIDSTVREIADFHNRIASDPPDDAGTVESLEQSFLDTIGTFERKSLPAKLDSSVSKLKEWGKNRLSSLKTIIRRRRNDGFVRHGHGDMHLANIVYHGKNVEIFDCIEFNERFRWIDVIDDVSFFLMDLRHRGFELYENRALNGYLSLTGDYPGLKLVNFYRVYRAMVRARVSLLKNRGRALDAVTDYFRTAESYLSNPSPVLVLTHGYSGSGKTTFTQPLLERGTMIRIRSDVERKRMADVDPAESLTDAQKKKLYSVSMTATTYERLARLSQVILEAGWSVVVDATFLKAEKRQKFARLAERKNVPCRILHFEEDEQTLKKRLRQRGRDQQAVSDADASVLKRQMEIADPLREQEQTRTVQVDSSTNGNDVEKVLKALRCDSQEEK